MGGGNKLVFTGVTNAVTIVANVRVIDGGVPIALPALRSAAAHPFRQSRDERLEYVPNGVSTLIFISPIHVLV